LEIKPSHIKKAGRGLFTKEFIKNNQRIGDYEGQLMCGDDKITDYSFTINNKWFVDSFAFPRCYIAMVNDPIGSKYKENCEFSLVSYSDKHNTLLPVKERKIQLIAIRDIEPGEELYASYGAGYWSLGRHHCTSDDSDSEEGDDEDETNDDVEIVNRFNLSKL
jgi:hypothetical protein